jgi:hypothetical protein
MIELLKTVDNYLCFGTDNVLFYFVHTRESRQDDGENAMAQWDDDENTIVR